MQPSEENNTSKEGMKQSTPVPEEIERDEWGIAVIG